MIKQERDDYQQFEKFHTIRTEALRNSLVETIKSNESVVEDMVKTVNTARTEVQNVYHASKEVIKEVVNDAKVAAKIAAERANEAATKAKNAAKKEAQTAAEKIYIDLSKKPPR